MKNILRNKNKTIFVKFILSYFWILLIPMIISMFTYYRLSNVLHEKTETYNHEVLKQFQLVTDEKLKMVEKLGMNIALTPSVNRMRYVDREMESWEIYNLSQTIKDLRKYEIQNEYILDFYIYYSKSDQILTKHSKYSLENFYKNNIYYTDKDFNQWKYMINRHNNKKYLPMSEAIRENEKSNIITYLQSIPFDVGKNDGNIVILINGDNLLTVLQNTSLLEYGTIKIVSNDGELIYASNDSKRDIDIIEFKNGVFQYDYGKEKYVVICVESEFNSWKYISIIPYSFYIRDAQRVKTEILIFIITAMFLALCLAFFLTSKNINPIKKLVEKMKNTYADSESVLMDIDELKFIDNTTNTIIHQNFLYKKKIEDHQTFLKKSIALQLLLGVSNKENDVKESLSLSGISFQYDFFCVAIIKIKDFGVFEKENCEMLKYALNNMMCDLTKELLYFVLTDSDWNEITMIANGNGTEESFLNTVKQVSLQLSDVCKHYFSVELNICVGNVLNNVMDMNISFKNAKYAFEYAFIMNNEGLTLYSDIQNYSGHYKYDMETEGKILNNIRMGNAQGAKEVITQIWAYNFKTARLSFEMIKGLYFEIYKTMQKICKYTEDKDMDIKEAIERIFEKRTNTITLNHIEFKKVIDEIIDVICDDINKSSPNKKDIKKDAILEYINENLNNPNISLQIVAEEFNITTSYLSYFFKEKTGNNFSDYLRKLRISYAEILLKDHKKSIKEIAYEIGYVNSNVFIRNFKKVKGLTPGQYRDMGIENIKKRK